MQPWHAWKEGGTDIELSAVTAALLRQLRLRPPPSSAAAAFPSLPAATPPLPLWQCKCAAGEGVGGGWHSQRTAACGACGARFHWRTARMRWPREGVDDCDIVTPRGATLLQPHDTSLMLLRGAFRAMLWMVAGGGDLVKAKDNPWRHCTMGLAWRVSKNEYLVALQGLGSGTHPMGVCHPHAPLMLRVTPEGGTIVCSAAGCKFNTGVRPLANTADLFTPPAGAQVPIGRGQWEHQDSRVAWLQCVINRYRNGAE